jgi:hypothetical protein
MQSLLAAEVPLGVVLQEVDDLLDVLRRAAGLDGLGQLVDDVDQVFVLDVDRPVPGVQRVAPRAASMTRSLETPFVWLLVG